MFERSNALAKMNFYLRLCFGFATFMLCDPHCSCKCKNVHGVEDSEFHIEIQSSHGSPGSLNMTWSNNEYQNTDIKDSGFREV